MGCSARVNGGRRSSLVAPVHTLRGTIGRVYMGSMNDWPEFELVTAEGQKSSWTREAKSIDLAP